MYGIVLYMVNVQC